MRLVNIHTLKLHDFNEGSIPPYAILSHRWSDEELTFKEYAKNRADVESKGYKKLLGACRIAAEYEVDFIWIDTCCIDKRSSAELSESINSMYAWYQQARVCLAYLEDVYTGPNIEENFKQSVWLTRAWTLQELLAPKGVEFFDHDWTRFGSKIELFETLEEITGISIKVLDNKVHIYECSVAERMSWASSRSATRKEDIAYSLLGIFNINMPLLYGEGTKAFQRLQQEILRTSTDATILCWGINTGNGFASERRLLAESPADFKGSKGVQIYSSSDYCQFGITNTGLEIRARTMRWAVGTWGIVLGTRDFDRHIDLEWEHLYVLVAQRAPDQKEENFTICNKGRIVELEKRHFWTEKLVLHVQWGVEGEVQWDDDPAHGFHVHSSQEITLTPVRDRDNSRRWIQHAATGDAVRRDSGYTWYLGDVRWPAMATLNCRASDGTAFFVELMFDFAGRPCCLVRAESHPSGSTIEFATRGSLMRERMDGDYSMAPIQGSRGKYWFLRGQSDDVDTCAIIPNELIGDHEAWVIFIPPRCVNDSDQEKWWTFKISPERSERALQRTRYDIRRDSHGKLEVPHEDQDWD